MTGDALGYVKLLPVSGFRSAGHPLPLDPPHLDLQAKPPTPPNPSYTIVPTMADATTMSLPEMWAVIQINQGFGITQKYAFEGVPKGMTA